MSPVDDLGAEEFIPLFPDDANEETILARWQAWANEGLTPDDVDEWVDVRPGSFWYIACMPGIREAARIYDQMGTDYPSAAFALWSWGEYLDDIAEAIGVTRLAATFASGEATFTGAEGDTVPAGARVAVEGAADGTPGPEYEVQADGTIAVGDTTVTVPITAAEAGSAGNVGGAAIVLMVTPLADTITAVTNADPISGGSDVETDEGLRQRVIDAFQSQGSGTVRDYERWALSYAGVGFVFVLPLWDGPGTVKVVILDSDRQPSVAAIIDGLQAYLDPVAGTGAGQAPIGATVTVTTAALVDVDVTATVEPEEGYSLDGTAGTVNLTPALEEAITAAVEAGEPGGEVVRADVQGRMMRIAGVHDVGGLTLSGAGPNGNVALDDDPAQVGAVGTIDLTEGSV